VCQAYRRNLVHLFDQPISDLFMHLFSDCWSVLVCVSEWFSLPPYLQSLLVLPSLDHIARAELSFPLIWKLVLSVSGTLCAFIK
jgi:hypothetical protein